MYGETYDAENYKAFLAGREKKTAELEIAPDDPADNLPADSSSEYDDDDSDLDEDLKSTKTGLQENNTGEKAIYKMLLEIQPCLSFFTIA